MIYPNYKYIDTAIEGLQNRNQIIDVTTLRNFTGKPECYRSIFRFDERYVAYHKEHGSISGYKGKCIADWLPIDIDDDNIGVAYRKTELIIHLLRYDYDFGVKHLFFSGSKGFHILLPIVLFGNVQPSEKLPAVFKEIVESILADENIDGKPIFDAHIYQINALLRLTNTVNKKSGLHKIPLTMQQFSQGIDSIKKLAATPQKVLLPLMTDFMVNGQLKEIFDKFNKNGVMVNSSGNGENKKKASLEADGLLGKFKEGVSAGERNVIAAKLAGLLRSKGLDRNFALQILESWNQKNKPPLEKKELMSILRSIFRYGKEEEEEEQEIERSIVPIWSIYDDYREFSKSEKKVTLGLPDIDRKIRGIRPGQVLTIMAYTGTYKSAMLQNFLRYYHNYSNEPVLMFELEMNRLDLFERSIQLEAEISGDVVEKCFIEDDEESNKLVELLKKRQQHFYIVDTPGLSYEDMVKYVMIGEEKVYKQKTGLVGVDFIQLLDGDGYNEIQRMNDAAEKAKYFAKRCNVPVIQLSQITGVSSNEAPVHLMDARNSKSIAHMSDYVIGLWVKKPYLVISLLKNRKGGLCTVHVKMNPKSLRYDVIDMELEEYKIDNGIGEGSYEPAPF